MALKDGPYTDESGRTYYVVTNDDGTQVRQYSQVATPSRTTTVGMNGTVVQPQAIQQNTPPTSPASLSVPENALPQNLSDSSDLGAVSAQPGQNLPNTVGQSARGYDYLSPQSDNFGANTGFQSDNGVPNASSYYNTQALPGPALPRGNAVVEQGGGQEQGGYRQQVTVPSTGASAGPFGPTAPRAPSAQAYGGQAGPDLPNSGGGGGRSALYDKLSAKGHAMAGNVRGMAEGVGGGSDPEAQYKAQQQRYRQQGRRVSQATRKWERMQAQPNYLPVRGVLKDLGVNKGMAMGMLGETLPILERVQGRPMVGSNWVDQRNVNTPWTDLALLSAGTGRARKLTSKTPTDRLPHVLKQQGWDQPKPENKRTLDPSKVANEVRDLYQQFIGGGTKPQATELLGNLAGLRKKSALGTQLRTTAKYDPAGALDSVRSLMSSAVMGGRPPTLGDDTIQRSLDMQIGGAMAELAGHRPNKITKGVRNVANTLLTRRGLA